MRELLATVKQIAPKNVNVLILGETEAGKELVASLIHGMSKRAHAPLVRLNCAGPPRTSRSQSCSCRYAARSPAPTGIGRVSSVRRRAGPVVLDEIGELPLPTKPKLLRVRQNGERGRLRTVVRAHRAYRPQVPQNRQMRGLLAFRLTRHVSRTACLCGWSVGN